MSVKVARGSAADEPKLRSAYPALCVHAPDDGAVSDVGFGSDRPPVDAGGCPCSVQIPVEHVLEVCSAGRLLMRITCTPVHLAELVVGRLFSEGMIASIDELSAVSISADSSVADIVFASGDLPAASSRGEVDVVPTYGTTGRPVPAAERGAGIAAARDRGGAVWDVESVFSLARVFAADTPIHTATNGAHSCYLAVAGELKYCCEDLGRHNALDKVIGSALLAGDDLSRALVFSSGRIPADMIGKVIRAGIPALVTKAVPTDLAVRMAREAGLVLICSARPDSIKVFNDPASFSDDGALL